MRKGIPRIMVAAISFLLAVTLAPANAGNALAAGSDSLAQKPVFPQNVMTDGGAFSLFVNEEKILSSTFSWSAGGAFSNTYIIHMAGQSVTTSLAIDVDTEGLWKEIRMETAQGPVTVTREGAEARIKFKDTIHTLKIPPGTILFENFSPALMSLATAAYDRQKGGAQTFPVFMVPQIVMNASVEMIGVSERFVAGEPRLFTLFRYGLPGVDVTVWVDAENRVCYGDVPAQRATYVREGYEALMIKEIADSLLSRPSFEVALDTNIMIPMRDGIALAADVYRPAAEGKFPVILVRTPYSKEMSELTGRFYARRGYVFVAQDCRGRFSSGGTWNPFFNEAKDGYDTIEWLAVRPWSTGKVGMIGASYLGWVQLWAASENPPHLAAIIPNVAPPDPYFNIPYEYGSFFLLGAIWWADVLEKEATADLSGKAMSEINDKEYATLLRHLPVIDLDEKVLGKKNRYWREWIKHPANDSYWAGASFLERLAAFTAPVYHQSGWFDGDGIGSKLNYRALAEGGRRNQKLVLGPWGHSDRATRWGPNERDFGPNATIDLEGSYLRWLDRHLKEIENGIDREPPVALFVMNTNRWLTGDAYPLAGTTFAKLYLASGGKANTSKGDGALSFDPPQGAAFDSYVYDPGDPTPDPRFYVAAGDSAGETARDSAVALSTEGERARQLAYYGTVDEERSDILVYETPPMGDSLVIAGPVSAVLYASTSARDTDWFMRLSEIDERGLVFPLAQGTIRARFRESFSRPKLLEPGEIHEYRIDLWQTGITIPKGRRLRVEVASASFPTFSRNLNTGKHSETEKKFVAATQRIYHDAAHPSHVVLPVIERPEFRDRPW